MNAVILGVGSNIDPEKHIRMALELLSEIGQVEKVSQWVKTAPVGISDQPDFINGAVKITTSLEREALARYLKKLEERLGRDRSAPKFGPRTIDLDIVVWNGQITDPDYYTRDFLKKSVDVLM